jgi:hypothetical protein
LLFFLLFAFFVLVEDDASRNELKATENDHGEDSGGRGLATWWPAAWYGV